MGLTQVSEKGIKDGEILNADINASAAIAGSKISPDFGSQNIVTTGTLTANNINANSGLDISIISGTVSAIFPNSSQVNGITGMPSQSGTPFVVAKDTGTNRSAIFAGNVATGNLDVTGDINLTGELNMIAGSDGQRFFDARVGSSALTFRGTTGGDANHQELARFFRGGGCELNHNGNKKFETYTDGVQVTGVLRGTTSGFGIDFAETSNASGMSSEVLDDYEEGTWTPIFADASSGGVASSSYTHQVGWYTKIGNLVNVQGRLSGCDTTGLTGSHAFYIRNLPYAMESSSHRLITGSALCSNINIDSDTKSIGVLANVGSSANTWFRFFQVKDNASWTILPVSTVPDGNNEFLWNFSYRVA